MVPFIIVLAISLCDDHPKDCLRHQVVSRKSAAIKWLHLGTPLAHASKREIVRRPAIVLRAPFVCPAGTHLLVVVIVIIVGAVVVLAECKCVILVAQRVEVTPREPIRSGSIHFRNQLGFDSYDGKQVNQSTYLCPCALCETALKES